MADALAVRLCKRYEELSGQRQAYWDEGYQNIADHDGSGHIRSASLL